MSAIRSVFLALALPIAAASAQAQAPPSLKVTDRVATQTLTLRDLVANHTLVEITVPDRIYGRPMTYRAIPMVDFLKNLKLGADDYLKATALDNFSVEIPVRLLRPATPLNVEAFLAIEDPANPWPAPPKETEKDRTGPFYIVWRSTAPAHVSREYWTDQLASLTVTDSPLKRWPGLDVAATVPPADAIRTGLDRYVALCITCHKVHGIGGSGAAAGPDLAQPKSITETLDSATLKKFIRSPKSVRPDSKMPKFDEAALSDDDLDAMIAWLAYAGRPPR